MDLRDVRDLIKLLDESNLTKLEIEDPNGFKLKLEKNCSEAASKSVPVRGAESVLEDEQKLDNTISARDLDQALKTITSPMVGTFYRAPAPDAEPFVKEGSTVDVGDTLCIIEAMKLMNEITSEYRGRIVKILVENGQPIEYNQPLFLLERV
ncbi:MAG: acetyl-CoA carboxylase biotin carboxyl carrier protein [Bacillota bacterium]|jgi:acetyl-CoA carboxylase biotin carboxyl carrier protein|nr:acetyl-CoA carboxylase biotin carboxyl carrier protein [Bacillota bacterium]NLU55132.1 acetyl-CoA carboxylase biotin carboxyl carrier protein [Bacillota bacterium]